VSTPSIRQQFLNCLNARQGKKQKYTLKVKDADISISLEMLPKSTRPDDVRDMAKRIGCKGGVKDEEGILNGTGSKTFLPGEEAAGIVQDMIDLSRGLHPATAADPPADPKAEPAPTDPKAETAADDDADADDTAVEPGRTPAGVSA
jgi:hypothetical protein